MASITKYNDKWRAQVYVAKERESRTFETESEARAWAAFREDRLRKKAELGELLKVGEGIPHFPRRIVEAMYAAPLTYAEVIEGTIPTKITCGIYFLVKNDRIMYVGQSTNVLRRLARHIEDGKDFDSFAISPCPKDDLDRMEAIYITAFYPERNTLLGSRMRARA